ncbi:MAG: hypothetical protein ACK518_03200 [bacterium]
MQMVSVETNLLDIDITTESKRLTLLSVTVPPTAPPSNKYRIFKAPLNILPTRIP